MTRVAPALCALVAALVAAAAARADVTPPPPCVGSGLVAIVEGLPAPVRFTRMEARPIGEDVLLQAYVHEP